ncbi:adenosine deaminase [Clohesyomyces aquaticus]|uniref:Adenine deaminase n=1 Tax=Clohesyomyces aquaticus TaxID=1231657 RepID=A0A1Y1ZUU5_9PLEO|nr:adenosine deaminase [Clohesyomyces aquaticus]
MASLSEFVAKMPKAELHVHIEGTLTPSLTHKFAKRNSVPIPEAIRSLDTSSNEYAFHDLPSFLAVYYSAMSVLLTAADFCDLVWAYLQKAHSQNVLHTEMFFDPQAHTSRGVSLPTVIEGIRQGIVKAEQELGISTNLIMCFLRDLEPGFAMATLIDALPYKDWIIAVGLDSDERDNPPAKFANVFQRAKAEGFLVTCHCDVDQKDSIEHIRQVLVDIGVNRIDHGTNIVEDETLVDLVKLRGIGLTCCPISDSVVTKDFKGKEILQLLRSGVKVTVNSDDPAYFKGYMNENILRLADDAEVSRLELVQLQKNAFEISWISEQKREIFLEALSKYAETV